MINLEQIYLELRGKIGNQYVIDDVQANQEIIETKSNQAQKEYMFARIFDFNFVVEIDSVIEVIEGYEVTRIYDNNSFVRGLINLRGKVITCIDISSDLGHQQIVIDERNKYIVLKFGKYDFALCVHDVIGIKFYDQDEFKPSNSILTKEIAQLFLSVSEQDGETVLQLSAESIVNSPKLSPYKLDEIA